MSELLSNSIKIFQSNTIASLKDLGSEFDVLERKARCCYFIGQVLSESKNEKSEISPMFEEIFIDLFQSITACLNAQYRLAYQSLRSGLELTVAAVYFYDHLIEFKQWKNDNWDFQFSIIKELLSESYARAIGVTSPSVENIKEQYRFLSQFVHGKYGFMTTVHEGSILQYENKRSVEFISIFEKVFECIIDLVTYRFSEYFTAICEKYPYFRNIHH